MSAETAPSNAPTAAGRELPLPAPVLVALGLLGLAVAASFAPVFVNLARDWENPSYSHGYLVIPIALLILWQRREQVLAAPVRPALTGWVLLAALLAARVPLYERNEVWLEQVVLVLAVAALTLALGGWRILRAAAPAVAFLAFMLPLPGRINNLLAAPLQKLATIGSTALLQGLGLPVISEGNTILVGAEPLEVAQACNGLSMLLSFVTLITATVLTVARDRPLWERLVLFFSAVPIALIANILRITATACLYYFFGPKAVPPWPLGYFFATIGDLVHDTAGWAMMPIALVLVWLEMKVLAWLVVEEDVSRPMLFMPAPSGAATVIKK